MSDAPPRLIDDAAFMSRTGIDLSAEAELFVDVAAEPVKQKLLAAVATGAVTATAAHTATLSMAVKAAVVSAVVGAGAGGTVVYVAGQPRGPAPVVAPVDAGLDEGAPDAGPQAADAGPADAGRPQVVRKKRRPPPKAAPGGDLAAELSLYQRGEAALQARKWAVAEREFAAYLKAYGKGSLREEAQLGRLTAQMGGGKYQSVLRLSARLLKDPALRSRRGELHRLRGDAEAKLGRCDAAAQSYARAEKAGGSGLTPAAIERALSACGG